MSAAPLSTKPAGTSGTEQNAGSIALLLLRFTLMGCALALVGTLVSIVWKAFA